MTVLGRRALNRATLARQLLLDRAGLPVAGAVAHLCGPQAQEPQEPCAGLWSRLRSFDPVVLSDLLARRRLVRCSRWRRPHGRRGAGCGAARSAAGPALSHRAPPAAAPHPTVSASFPT
ncbi:DNA glycosylase AlkZ-like family protein [Micromonospora tulbaghiae]|uniref:DNA glycosylase AlkZ-like family protein n=1 Tax=Micromonospora tulbaghiae TaxID=479978 RepID=UPI000AEF6285|nr:crosslink repair DNA glycosylase YcaQ family protein [Micromonospora tulbaghiae]MDX5459096.1 winged helix DNA-binding domain-containing protein [Micromonospora tulbaghiae]